MKSYLFPRHKVLCNERPFSRELLQGLLDLVYTASPPFTGYLKTEGIDPSPHFLFFFNGKPYAAGRVTEGKQISYSIQEFGGHLASPANKVMYVSLCETDPVLLKCMLLFLQKVPDVKAPTSLFDIEYIVRQMSEVGTNAMIALCRDYKFNFFFFEDGKGALAYYSDMAFKRPEGMTIDEEMQLYAFHQPGDNVQAFIYHDMLTTMAEDTNLLDKDTLHKLLTVGYLENRRRGDTEISPVPDVNPKNTHKEDIERPPGPAMGGIKVPVEVSHQKTEFPSVVLSAESGPQQGGRFTVKPPCTIGRKNCDLILEDRYISRRHAELKIAENILTIEDLGSKNGTMVNGVTVTKKRLIISNDLISIGSTKLRVSPA